VPGVDGLVHISDMSWTRRINHPSEVVSKGQDVEAVITSVDVLNQRISLSMKELLPNEWEEYANAHGVGDVVSGTVTNITDFGVFVELAPGVEGLCHISEIDRDMGLSLPEMFQTAQAVACRILRVDWNENRIGLSMHGVSQEAQEAVATGGELESEKPAETAMAAALRAGGLVEEQEEESGDGAELESAADEGETAAVEEAAVAEVAETPEETPAVEDSEEPEEVEAVDASDEQVDAADGEDAEPDQDADAETTTAEPVADDTATEPDLEEAAPADEPVDEPEAAEPAEESEDVETEDAGEVAEDEQPEKES
jgi:small subunit ribosomal protein S1